MTAGEALGWPSNQRGEGAAAWTGRGWGDDRPR